MAPADAVYIDRLVRGVVDESEERPELLDRWLHPGVHRQVKIDHSVPSNAHLLTRIGIVAGEVEDRPDAQAGKRGVIVALRLGATEVAGIDLPKISIAIAGIPTAAAAMDTVITRTAA